MNAFNLSSATVQLPAHDTTLTLRPEDAAVLERGEIVITWFGDYRLCDKDELLNAFRDCYYVQCK